MIILLDRTENIEITKEFLRTVCSEESAFDLSSIVKQTDLDNEDMQYKIDVYVR